ncbi:MAG: heme exporter protein CcmB [Chloroflexota bacterium]
MSNEEVLIEKREAAPAVEPSAGLRRFMGAVAAIVWKDLVIERHTRQTLSIMIVFSLAAVIVFNFALELRLNAAREVSTGLLWIVILLAGTLGLNRSLANEQENHNMEAVLMAPVDRSAIYLGKVTSISLFVFLLEAVLIPVFIAFFNKPYWRPQVILIIILGTIGYVAAGVLVSSMSIQTRSRDVLLPVLLLPLSLPSVLAAATAVSAYMLPELPPWNEVQTPIALVVAFDVLMLTAGFLTYQFVVEE